MHVDIIVSPPVTVVVKNVQIVAAGRVHGQIRTGRPTVGPRLGHGRCKRSWRIRTGTGWHRAFVPHAELADPGGPATASVNQHLGHAPNEDPRHRALWSQLLPGRVLLNRRPCTSHPTRTSHGTVQSSWVAGQVTRSPWLQPSPTTRTV